MSRFKSWLQNPIVKKKAGIVGLCIGLAVGLYFAAQWHTPNNPQRENLKHHYHAFLDKKTKNLHIIMPFEKNLYPKGFIAFMVHKVPHLEHACLLGRFMVKETQGNRIHWESMGPVGSSRLQDWAQHNQRPLEIQPWDSGPNPNAPFLQSLAYPSPCHAWHDPHLAMGEGHPPVPTLSPQVSPTSQGIDQPKSVFFDMHLVKGKAKKITLKNLLEIKEISEKKHLHIARNKIGYGVWVTGTKPGVTKMLLVRSQPQSYEVLNVRISRKPRRVTLKKSRETLKKLKENLQNSRLVMHW